MFHAASHRVLVLEANLEVGLEILSDFLGAIALEELADRAELLLGGQILIVGVNELVSLELVTFLTET